MQIQEIPVDEKIVPCRFAPLCFDSAVGRYSAPHGCTCFPNDTEQDLCVQHAITAEPLGPFELTVIYQPSLVPLLPK